MPVFVDFANLVLLTFVGLCCVLYLVFELLVDLSFV